MSSCGPFTIAVQLMCCHLTFWDCPAEQQNYAEVSLDHLVPDPNQLQILPYLVSRSLSQPENYITYAFTFRWLPLYMIKLGKSATFRLFLLHIIKLCIPVALRLIPLWIIKLCVPAALKLFLLYTHTTSDKSWRIYIIYNLTIKVNVLANLNKKPKQIK